METMRKSMNFPQRTKRFIDGISWLALNSYIEAYVVDQDSFRQRYRQIKGRYPVRGGRGAGHFTVPRSKATAKKKGGIELRVVIPKKNRRYRTFLEDDLGLTPLGKTPNRRGWRKGATATCFFLLQIGFDIGHVRGQKYPHQLNEHELEQAAPDVEKIVEFIEGTKRQIEREMTVRSAALVRDAKQFYKPPVCYCCKFDFGIFYGELGEGYIEAHHLKPISEYGKNGAKVTVDDIRLVCANCHRMLHRGLSLRDVDDLKRIVQKQRVARAPCA
jgi:predicted HNH restriction endonuclease